MVSGHFIVNRSIDKPSAMESACSYLSSAKLARNSSFTYKGKAVDIKQVGRELGVRYVLEDSVRNATFR